MLIARCGRLAAHGIAIGIAGYCRPLWWWCLPRPVVMVVVLLTEMAEIPAPSVVVVAVLVVSLPRLIHDLLPLLPRPLSCLNPPLLLHDCHHRPLPVWRTQMQQSTPPSPPPPPLQQKPASRAAGPARLAPAATPTGTARAVLSGARGVGPVAALVGL